MYGCMLISRYLCVLYLSFVGLWFSIVYCVCMCVVVVHVLCMYVLCMVLISYLVAMCACVFMFEFVCIV